MNISRIDLNLLVYLDVLLRQRNVTKAANQLGISQPAMSNGLRRLRDLFGDPLLVRTSEGMMPTERAQELQPVVREMLASVEKAIQPITEFDALNSDRVFRIMASDYTESTLAHPLLTKLRELAPNLKLDIMTPSDVSYEDVEQGKCHRQRHRERLDRHIDKEHEVGPHADEREGAFEHQGQPSPYPPDGAGQRTKAAVEEIVAAAGTGHRRAQLRHAEHPR